MELIIQAVIVLASCYLGYKMGKGQELSLPNIKKFKPVLRTEEQEAKLLDKLRSK